MEIRADIIKGDCREELKKLKDDSIDLIFTSPPCVDSA
jgi:DNA modification methylase